MISGVREIYHGYLTYCSVFYPVETQQIGFWADLDFIGMDTYIPLMKNTTDTVPTLSGMLTRFDTYFTKFEQWRAAQPANVSGLPAIITESGYPR